MASDRTYQIRGLYHAATIPIVGYWLLLCWQKGWLPRPHGIKEARLKDGRHLRCELSDRTQRTMFLDLFEPAETHLLLDLLAPGDTFIDVGAHIGWFSTLASRIVQPSGRVIACEPYPANAAALRENLALNGAMNVEVVEAALGGQVGALRLAMVGDSGDVTSLDWARRGHVDVPMTTLDEITPEAEYVKLLKIDVEGWETNVLRGGARTLAHTSNVMIEINRPALKRANTSADEIFDLLRQAGFTNFLALPQIGLRRLLRSDDVTNMLASRLSAGT